MAVWFIRLGKRTQRRNWRLYQDLAETYSIVMIGYAIDSDFTQLRSEIQIRSRLKTCLQGRGHSPTDGQLDARARLIHLFINEVRRKELVISPHKMTPDSFRIGIVKSNCKRVDSFFRNQNTLQNLISSHPRATQNPVEPKPAKKVTWEYENVPLNRLPAPLRQAMINHKHLRPTTNKLDVGGSRSVNMTSLNRPQYQIGKGLGIVSL